MRSVQSVRAMPNLAGARIDLSWQNPPVSDFAGGQPLARILIVRQIQTFATTPAEGVAIYDGAPITGYSDIRVIPLTTYYYTIFTVDAGGAAYTDTNARIAVYATQDYGMTEQLYRLLPAVHLRRDTRSFDQAPVPPALRRRGQLRRFIDVIGSPFDLMRSFAEGLPDLHRPDVVRPEFLPGLAQWLGWELDRTLPLYAQRNEVRLAPHLYRTVGTVENLRTLVTRYTGWHAQATEFAQQIAQSNHPAQFNIYALEDDGSGGWRSPNDAAAILGFGTGNDDATGTNIVAATLTGTATEPFALRPGMTLVINVDRRLPVVLRMQSADFADMSTASAAEVVAVINRTFSQCSATAVGGQVQISAHSTGPDSTLQVPQATTETITLEGAPDGPLSVTTGNDGRHWLFYEHANPLRPVHEAAAAAVEAGQSQQHMATISLRRQIRMKCYRNGRWGKSQPLLPPQANPHGEPAAVTLPDGRLWVAYVADDPANGAAPQTLHFVIGQPTAPTPATLTGQQGEPFLLPPGSTLMLRNSSPRVEGLAFTAADFANPFAAQAIEVRNVLNARLANTIAIVGPGGTLQLTSVATGEEATLQVDLANATAASALGFTADNAAATGSSGDRVAWSTPASVPAAATGRHATPYALVDADDVLWLFWAQHGAQAGDRRRQIVAARWDIATASWLDNTPQVLGSATGQQREPTAVLDANDRVWLCWAQRNNVGEGWRLRYRRFSGGSWDAEQELITPPPTVPVDLREPAFLRQADDGLRLFFRSNRRGGDDLWSVTIDPATAAVSTPEAVTSEAPANRWPTPLLHEGQLWLLYRSDRSVDPAQQATGTLPALRQRRTLATPASEPPAPEAVTMQSSRLPQGGTLQRFAGTTTVIPGDTARNALRRARLDLLSYTPQNPRADRPLTEDELYTRGTVGLYLSRIVSDSALSRQRVERLRTVLQRFLPINVRVVVILAPRVDVELVYTPEADIGEAYQDNYPFVDTYSGLSDLSVTDLPDWVLLLSNLADHVSGDPATLATLRGRTYTAWLDG